VVYSAWTAGGYRDVRLVDVATGTFVDVTHDRALDVDPIFSPDDRTIYFSSDRTGIFNIHAYDVATAGLKQVTNLRTGAFMPAGDARGATLVSVGYTKDGYALFPMPLDRARFLDALDAPHDRPDPPEEPSVTRFAKPRYEPLPTLLPRHYLVKLSPS